MIDIQNVTQGNKTDVVGIPYEMLPFQQQQWIDYCAIQGLITNDDGSMTKMSIQECADNLGVTRKTLYEWKKTIPNFQDLVMDRCKAMFDGPRTVKVVNAMYLAATSKLNVQAMALWMANQSRVDFRMPTQEIKHEAGNSWAALLEGKRKGSDGIVEGEVVNDVS